MSLKGFLLISIFKIEATTLKVCIVLLYSLLDLVEMYLEKSAV